MILLILIVKCSQFHMFEWARARFYHITHICQMVVRPGDQQQTHTPTVNMHSTINNRVYFSGHMSNEHIIPLYLWSVLWNSSFYYNFHAFFPTLLGSTIYLCSNLSAVDRWICFSQNSISLVCVWVSMSVRQIECYVFRHLGGSHFYENILMLSFYGERIIPAQQFHK